MSKKWPKLRFSRFIKKLSYLICLWLIASATRKRRDIQMLLRPAGPHTKNLNIVIIHHGWMQKHDFSVLDQKYPFWANLMQTIKIFDLKSNSVIMLIRICRIQGDVHFFSFWPEIPFLDKFEKKIVSLNWNLLD